ncbi:hypothetical protein QBC47DRAFT_22220 [Echria macrotheca]|uniref:F-box domain-containing protein n=1 Tax=Echria macrotheca TaxID=438768 RepID=A0AAJ0BMQ0_9PEZI|nr:hypothetical protein QBC47DRAFT_22220 [Echria macrotheca]
MSYPDMGSDTPILGLQDMPVEIAIAILQHLDIEAVDSVQKTSRRFRKIVETNWTVILRPIIDSEMTPIGSFMHVLTIFNSMTPTNTAKHHLAMYYEDVDSLEDGSASDEVENDIDSNSDSSGEDDTSSSIEAISDDDEETPGNIDDLLTLTTRPVPERAGVGNDRLPDQWAAGLSFFTVMKACRLTKAWEKEFHRLRFACPHHRRTLQTHELQRLRHGLYVWWRYASSFHDTAQPLGDEHSDSTVARMEFVRQFSTSQLHEIRDMWETIKSAVGREICPSIAAVQRQSGNVLSWAEAARVGWGDQGENLLILGTLMKLRPEDILYLLVHRHRFATKASIIQFARFKNPWIEDSVETLTDSVQWALWERERQLVVEYGPRALDRRWYFPPRGYFPRPWGGIVDYKRAESEQLRDVYNRDTGAGVTYWIDEHGGLRRYVGLVPTGRLVVGQGW